MSVLSSYPPPEMEAPNVQELVMAFENLMALVDLYDSLLDEGDLDYDNLCLIDEARKLAEVAMLREFIPERLRELERATRHPPAAIIKTGSK